jgi:hypothetical protein
MGKLLDYAKTELEQCNYKGNDSDSNVIKYAVLELIEVFENQSHTDFTRSQTISILSRLLKYKPVMNPIMGTDDEWECIKEGITKVYKNKRLGSLYKHVDESGNITSIYDMDAVRISKNGGLSWFAYPSDSKFINYQITFPYIPPVTPKLIYVKKLENGEFEEITDIEEIKQCAVEYLTKFDKEKVIK